MPMRQDRWVRTLLLGKQLPRAWREVSPPLVAFGREASMMPNYWLPRAASSALTPLSARTPYSKISQVEGDFTFSTPP